MKSDLWRVEGEACGASPEPVLPAGYRDRPALAIGEEVRRLGFPFQFRSFAVWKVDPPEVERSFERKHVLHGQERSLGEGKPIYGCATEVLQGEPLEGRRDATGEGFKHGNRGSPGAVLLNWKSRVR